jgi:hypothetical protein
MVVQEKYTFADQKSKNKPSESKNGIWAPKSIWLSDLYMNQE